MKPVFNTSKGVPKSYMGRWRSIEFELVFNSVKSINEFVALVEENKYDRYVTVKTDGSIHTKKQDYDGQPREVVVSYRKGNEKIVKEICSFLRSRAYVNRSCGAHVHFDMRGIKEERVKLYGNRLALAVPALRTILPKSRRSSSYCEEDINTFKTKKELKETDVDDEDWDDEYDTRYAFVNMHAYYKHKTIEIRGHSGTLNSRKILNWISLCDKIMHNAGVKKQSNTVAELIERYKLNKCLTDYVTHRYEKVNAPPPPKPEKEKTYAEPPVSIPIAPLEPGPYDFIWPDVED